MSARSNGPADFFEDLKTLLKYYEAMGLENIPVNIPPRAGTAQAERTERTVKGRGGGAGEGKPCSGTDASDKASLLQGLVEEIRDCKRCRLSDQRKSIVFGEGSPCARLMFIGEAPGGEEDIQGKPFVGEAGMLLTKLIEKMGLERSSVYIANIIKCRPPMNRDPEDDEVTTCRSYIERQIEILRPEVIMTLGRIAIQTLMNDPKIKISAARGHFLTYKGIPVMPTFHPAYLLRSPKDKWLTWSDAQKVMKKLGLD